MMTTPWFALIGSQLGRTKKDVLSKLLYYYDDTTITEKKSNYFIVRPKVDQRAGLLCLPHLGNFRRTATFTTYAFTS